MRNSQQFPILVCASDNTFTPHLAVTLLSAVTLSSSPLTIYVLDGGISAKNKERVATSLEPYKHTLSWIAVDDTALSSLTVGGHISHHTYYRLLIPYLLDKSISKVIYLDADLVINHDITKLWNEPIRDFSVLAAPCEYMKTGLESYAQLNIAPTQKYFNAGVLVMNLTKWRVDALGEKIISFIAEKPHLVRWHDQDGLNIFCENSWGEVNPRWNVQTQLSMSSIPAKNKRKGLEYKKARQNFPASEEEIAKIVASPYIIHFTTDVKPWNYGDNPLHSELYFHYLDKTPWKGKRQSFFQFEAALLKHRIRTKGIVKGSGAFLVSNIRKWIL